MAAPSTRLFSSTPRGARLARQLALHHLDTWGVPHSSPASDIAALLVAEECRGLHLVEALADRWDVLDRIPVGKTVVAELDLTH
ncbi:hypothetical protein ACWIG3_14990 [Streptomyces celluloflavus]